MASIYPDQRATWREITGKALARFLEQIKAAVPFDIKPYDPNACWGQPSTSKLEFALQMYDVGRYAPTASKVPLTMTNHISIQSMTGGAIQQGTRDLVQNVSIDIDLGAARAALANAEGLLAGLPREVADRLRPEFDTLRIQLSKPNPSPGTLLEVGRSIRRVLEGVGSRRLSTRSLADPPQAPDRSWIEFIGL